MATKEQIAKIVQLRGTGHSLEEIAAIVGLSKSSVAYQLQKLKKKSAKSKSSEVFTAALIGAAGAAGGIAATFNAPIAGAVFALEVLLRRFGSVYFGAVVISAVTADVIAHYFEGDQRTFLTPDYSLNSPWELLLYTLMGMLAALAAVLVSWATNERDDFTRFASWVSLRRFRRQVGSRTVRLLVSVWTSGISSGCFREASAARS